MLAYLRSYNSGYRAGAAVRAGIAQGGVVSRGWGPTLAQARAHRQNVKWRKRPESTIGYFRIVLSYPS